MRAESGKSEARNQKSEIRNQKSEIKGPAYVASFGLESAHLSRSQAAAATEGETPNAEAAGGDPRNQLSP